MRKSPVLLAVLLCGLLVQPAQAGPLDRWERKQERREDRLTNGLAPGLNPAARIDSREAARIAQARNGGGRVLDVVETREGWRVKLLKDGEVRTVLVPHH